MHKISVVLLSYKRIENIKIIIDSLLANDLIGEIIIWNNNSEIHIQYPGINVVNSSNNYLCIARYAMAMLCKNQTIYFQDDDIFIDNDSIKKLFDEYIKDTTRIYGHCGRNLDNGKYSQKNVYGECDIILGQAMLFSKSLLSSVYGKMLSLTPFERGDDIAFSLLCRKKHLSVETGSISLSHKDEFSLWRQPGHYEKRQLMVDRIMGIPPSPPIEQAP